MTDSPSSGQIVAQPNFTPAPWHYYLNSEGVVAIGHSSEAHEPGDIAHVYIPGATDPEYDDHNEGLANARLISAAPLMYEALKATETRQRLVREFSGQDGTRPADLSAAYQAVEAAMQRERELTVAALAAAQAPESTS